MGRRVQRGVRCPLPRLDNTELRQTIEVGYRAIKRPLPRSVHRSAVTRPSTGPCVRCYAGRQLIKFFVKPSVAISSTFDKWDATLTFTSPDVTTAVCVAPFSGDMLAMVARLASGSSSANPHAFAVWLAALRSSSSARIGMPMLQACTP